VKLFRRITYRHANGIIAQTKRAKMYKEELVGNSVPIKIIVNPLRELKTYSISKEKIILCVARHYYVKGIDRLIEAFAKLEHPDWYIEIAGSEGPETPKLLEQVERLGIANRVKFLGAIKDIDQVYSRASIFVLPSRSEGLPNALIEAMAHGLPCISFDINAGPSDLIQNNVNGVLIEDGKISELTNELNRFILQEDLRNNLGFKAISVKENHKVSKVCDDLLDFILKY
jgi:glycosyltransferase involved in cell wall biosynthesis